LQRRVDKDEAALGVRRKRSVPSATTTEDALIPFRSKLLGFGAMVPITASAAGAALVPPFRAGFVPRAAIVWSGTVLAFLGGVRRGLSFRMAGGPRPRQLGGMARSFGLAFAALLSPRPAMSCLLLAAGFSEVAIIDPQMAEHGEAPEFFTDLRPTQMALGVASLLVLAVLLRGSSGAAKSDG
jgi:hypothetical protein